MGSIEHPAEYVEQVGVVNRNDLDTILKWNSNSPEEVSRCLHDLFQEQATHRADALAICSWDGDMTYAKLNDSSSKLAYKLIELGVGPEIVVTLCFEKSKLAVVCMLAVLKAGGAIVFVDPDSAADRTNFILKEVQSSVVLVSQDHVDMFQGKVQNALAISEVHLQSLPNVDNTWFSKNLKVRPHNAAFIVFTSGSTGTPKGVVSTHASRATNAFPCGKAQKLDAKSRVLQFASYTFDASIGDIMTTLLFGGVICIPSESERLHDLQGAINRMTVDQACLTSSVVRLLEPESLPTLKKLAIGGESLAPDILAKWATHSHLTNIYGSTECDWAMANPGVKNGHSAANIGHALGGRAWIVSPTDHDSLAPIGTVGELLIEGPILAREYLNDPLLTTQKFIHDPRWAPSRGSRFYKTGDLAQYETDGSIRYIGRKDTLVKVRGQRIELSGIEHAAMEFLPAGMQLAAETVHFAGMKNEPVLAAFIAMGQQLESAYVFPNLDPLLKTCFLQAVDAIDIGLRQLLPTYMIPMVYLPLRELPVNNSFKRDRKKLRQLASKVSIESVQFASGEEHTHQPPSNRKEVLLSQLWSELLNVPIGGIGSGSIFSRLGGDSITAIHLASKLRATDISISVVDIFRHPRFSDMAEKLVDIEPQEPIMIGKPEPFELIDAKFIESVRRIIMVDESSIQDAYPCSPLQAGIMSLSIRDPGSYVSREIIKLPRDIDIQKLQRAWHKVAQTYEILRTRIIQTEELGFVQVVLEKVPFWCTAKSLKSYLSIDKERNIACGDSLIHFGIVGNSKQQDDLYLVWTIHHALYDAWSLDLMIEAVERVYDGLELCPSPSFNCFIQHKVRSLNSDAAGKFWTFYLNEPAALPFPEKSSASTSTHADRSMTRNILLPRRDDLELTFSTILHAAWGMVIASYTGLNDAVFGVTLSGRTIDISNVDRIVGPLITTVPVRIRFNNDETLEDILGRVQEEALAMVPFEHTGLQNIQQISAETKAACGFQTIMVIQPESGRHTEKPRYLSDRLSGDISQFNNYCILLECSQTPEGFLVGCSYDSKVIDHSEMKRVMQQFEHFVQHIVARRPGTTIERVVQLNPYDQEDIASWNKANPTAWACIHDLISQRARDSPGATALCFSDGRSMSYERLDKPSSLLSLQLETGRGDLVPLCFEKGMMLPVAMLAVLKSGAGFVLLDATYPTNRLLTIIGNTDAKLMIVSGSNTARFKTFGMKVIEASEASIEAPSTAPSPDSIASSITQPGDIAYAIYTSGSTGDPKGVLIDHASFSSGAIAHSAALGLTSSSRSLQFASFSYGAALIEMLSTLIVGGCVCIPREEERFSNLAGAINFLKVNWALLTPSVVKLIDRTAVSSLRTLVVGGEALDKVIMEKWGTHVRLIHAYGQSECSTVGLAMHMDETTNPSTIGHGLGAATWIVDSSNHNVLLPIGAVGELLIEGPIVSTRGYLGDEKKTAAAFLKDLPWATNLTSGGTFYKTGDLVRYNSDGSICYIGRKQIDEQIKINGQRVELGDIEHHITGDEMVRHAAVMYMRSWNKSQPSLVAVVSLKILPGSGSDSTSVSDTDSGIKRIDKRWDRIASAAISTLREALADSLPLHMVPSAWIVVEKVPLTASGKLDRKSTKKWLMTHSDEMRQSVENAPRRSSDERNAKPPFYDEISEAWSAVLKVPPTGVKPTDSFIALGGAVSLQCRSSLVAVER